jgi:hypothetical protein
MDELANIANILVVVVWLVVNTITEPTSINVNPLPGTKANGKDHPGYFGKVGMRYFHERKVRRIPLHHGRGIGA